MSNEPKTIEVDYYSDVLCVWAWIAQARLEELEKRWGKQISVNHHYLDIFGDCDKKIPGSWGAGDGYDKFAAHVKQSAEPFQEAKIHPDIWMASRPKSSAQAHFFLRAVNIVAGKDAMCDVALDIRRAFFTEAKDVSHLDVLLPLAADRGIDSSDLQVRLADGSAIAALTSDLRRASEQGIKGSPTWVLNEGRQTIYGNVGYRVLNANIEELLNRPEQEASWC